MPSERVARRLAAIMAADVAGYSRLMGADEEGTLAALKAMRLLVDGLIAEHGGRVFGSAGDSVVAEFASPVAAVRCAMAVQLALAGREASPGARMRLRIGVHLGDVMVDGDNLFGDGVNVAARLEALAPAGGLCLSQPVVEQVRERVDAEFVDLGQHRVKNIARPVRVFRVPLASEDEMHSPFRGLAVFETEHADLFFGRARAIAATKARLEGQAAQGKAFLLIYGMSGSGKSSLLRAGLIPALIRPGAVPGIALWRHCVIRPSEGPDPVMALVGGLLGAAGLPELADQGSADGLAAQLRAAPERAPAPIRAALAAAAAREGAAPVQARLVVAVDQMEELFTAESVGAATREGFVQLLAALAASGQVWVIGTIRADFFHRCGEVPGFSALKDGLGSYELLPPTGPEIAEIIREPARVAGLSFEEDPVQGRLEDALQQAASRDPASLPLLEFVLDALYQAGRRQRLLTFAAYRALGGLEGAIAHRADEVTDAFPAEVQAALPAVLRALTTVRLEDQAVGALPALRAEVAATPAQAALVEAFVEARLLVGDEDVHGEPMVRLAHEALLHQWPRARAIVAADREFLLTRARVHADAERWQADRRNPELLLPPGKRLAEADDLLAARGAELDALGKAYVEASAAAERARRVAEEQARQVQVEREAEHQRLEVLAARRLARRTRTAAVVTLILAAVAAAGAMLGFYGQREATQQADAARQLAAAAQLAEQDALASEREAERQAALALAARDQMLRNQSLFLADLSRQSSASGDPTTGLLLALEALPHDMAAPDRPYVVEAEAALYSALISLRETSLIGDRTGVSDAAFSPQGDRVVTAGRDGTGHVWDLASGLEVATLRGEGGALVCIAVSPDGKLAAGCMFDRTVRLWRTDTGTQLSVLQTVQDSFEVLFSPDGTSVVAVSEWPMVWDIATGEILSRLISGRQAGQLLWAAISPDSSRLLVLAVGAEPGLIWSIHEPQGAVALEGATSVLTSAVFSRDGTRIVATALDGVGSLWERPECTSQDCTENWHQLAELTGHRSELVASAISPDSRVVATVSADGTVRLWNALDGSAISVMGPDSARYPFTTIVGDPRRLDVHASFSPDGTLLAVADRDGEIRLWDVAGGSAVATLTRGAPLRRLAFSPDGSLILGVTHDGNLRFWNIAGTEAAELAGHSDAISDAVFSSDERLLATTSLDRTTRLWDPRSGTEIAVLSGHEGGVTRVAFSPDGRRVATGARDGSVRLWDTQSGSSLAVLQAEQALPVRDLAFNAAGDLLASASSGGTATLWDPSSGSVRATLRGHSGPIARIAFSPGEMLVATASRDGTSRVWSTADGSERFVLAGHRGPVNTVSFSPDGSRLVTASDDRTVRLWDAATGQSLAVLEGHGGQVFAAAFSPDGSQVVSAGNDHTARIWPVDGGAPLVLNGHDGAVLTAEFSPGGRQLATASLDGTARLWDAASGVELGAFSHRSPVRHVAFSPDGRQLATGSDDSTVRLFNVYPTTQELIEHARAVVPRELTPCERVRFFLATEGGAECAE